MIVRRIVRCPATRRFQVVSRPRLLPAKPRQYSTSTSSTTAASPASTPSMLGAFTNELDKIAPKFEVHGSQIQILRSPAEFYETLKAKILAAEERIFLSTLYIGKTEHELIATLQEALRKNRKVKVSILVDALRGTRESPEPSCASLLIPLVVEFGAERVDLRMYHTPNLTGLRRDYIPKRINEGWGLQHMKLYGVDDEIILSGANLSNDYFTNRQDRYHLFTSKAITDYFHTIHSTVSQLSYVITPIPFHENGYAIEWPSSNLAPSPIFHPKKYITETSKILAQLIKPTLSTTTPSSSKQELKPNTTIYPISQLTPLLKPDTSTELPAITTLLETLTSPSYSNSSWTFTAGYFNPDPSLTSLLLSTTSKSNVVITASPQANGFFGSKGISGLLPGAYTLLSRRFLESAHKAGRGDDITLREWKRGTVGEPGGWTYHAKGLWISLNGEKQPSISVVGSSNYTKRSYALDLEVGSVIVTRDEGLMKALGEERDGLGRAEDTKQMTVDDFARSERRVGIKVRVAMWIVKMVGGEL